jgi:hypothetical protein
MWGFLLAGALIGGAIGAWNTGHERNRQEAELSRQKKNAEKAYGYGKDLSDKQYSLQKGEALWQLGMQNRALNEGMDQFTGEFNTRLLARAYGEQDARIQTASGIGADAVIEGMGGTRGNAANQLARDYAEKGLERQIGVQRGQDADTLSGTMQNANRSVMAMGHERASWEQGGYRYEMKAANDLYNKNIYELGQENYQWHIDDLNSDESKILDFTTGVFGGASSGMGLARSIFGYDSDWGSVFSKKKKEKQ